MSVVVVNCSQWQSFPSLVRTRALDLYRPDNGVEFWHAAPQTHDSDTQVWGGWPKCFADPWWIMRDELEDLVDTHVTRVADTPDRDAIDPLVLIVVFDAAMLSASGRKERATAAVSRVMDGVVERLEAEQEHAPRILRSLWRIAVIRDSQGARGGRSARPATDVLVTDAWQLVRPRSRPPLTDQDSPEYAAFDTVVLLDGGLGNPDEGMFASLRVLIDLVRDDRVRQVLKPAVSRSASRVIKLVPPRIRFNPSDRVLINLDTQVRDYETSTERDEAADPLRGPVDTLREKMSRSEEHLLSRAAEVAGKQATPDPAIENTLRNYFDAPPQLADLASSGDVRWASDILNDARDSLQPFLNTRHQRLGDMRRAQDRSMREYSTLLEQVEVAATDYSLGQSGEVLLAINNAHLALKELQDEFIRRAEACRQHLNDEYLVELAAAHSKRHDRPLLSDFVEVGKFDAARTRLLFAFENWTSGNHFLLGWLAFAVFYLLTTGVIVAMSWRGLWTRSMAFSAASILVSALISAVWLAFRWRRQRRGLLQSVTEVQQQFGAAVAHIDRVTRLALAHLAGSRVAGRLKPFTQTLVGRRRDLLLLREATSRIFVAIRQDTNRRIQARGEARPSRDTSLKAKLKDASPQDWLKLVLEEMPPSELYDVAVTASGGELTGELTVRTALSLDAPISLAFMIEPGKRPEPPGGTNVHLRRGPLDKLPAKDELSAERDAADPTPLADDESENDAPVMAKRGARKPRRDKRPSG